MNKHVYILGQSNYAVSILLDTLLAQYPGANLSADIISNLPAAQNDSLRWPYETAGVTTCEIRWENWQPEPGIPCLIGSIGRSRGAIVQFFYEKFGLDASRYADTVHPAAVLAGTVQMGRGVHISPGAVVAPFAGLGDFVVLNRQCNIGHHTALADFVTVNPGVTIAGLCRIGRGVVLGAGATVLDQVAIGAGSVIGAGSLVTKDIPAGVVAYGSPAKVVRQMEGS